MNRLSIASGLAFLFDMDGVVVESTELHAQAWEIYLLRLGVPPNGIGGRMLGKRNDQIVRDVFGADLTEAEAAEHGYAKERLYREMMAPVLQSQLVKGVGEFLTEARGAGVPVALTTNAEPLNVEFILGEGGLRQHFLAIVDGHQVERPKPDPEVFLTAAGRLGVEPRNCIVFEDSPGGVEGALAAGARVAGLLTTMPSLPGVELEIRDFQDPRLRPWLSSLSIR